MKNKRWMGLFAIMLACILSSCGGYSSKAAIEEPDIMQIRNICNLATLDCYYHNVATSEKEAGGWLEKDRTFWIEYTGIARLGIDMSKVEMTINGDDVELTLPEAQVLGVTIDNDSLGEDSYITSEDSFFFSNKITVDDQTAAIKDAQKKMEETVKANSSLLLSAQNRAKVLIENYILKLGEAAGIEYNIKWTYIDSNKVNPVEIEETVESVSN